jgi:hypothetical protein
MARKAFFSEGRAPRVRVARPYVRRDIFIFTPCLDDDSAAYRGDGWMGPMVSLRACRARPSAGLVIRAGMALRGKPGDNAGGGFLGGAHSVRPRGEAIRKPRHNIIIGGKRTFGGLMG